MKLLALLCLVAVVLAADDKPKTEADWEKEYDAWLAIHDPAALESKDNVMGPKPGGPPVPPSPVVGCAGNRPNRTQRLQAFISNSRFIDEHNRLAARGERSYTLEANDFADYDEHEFAQVFLNLKPSSSSPSSPFFPPRRPHWLTPAVHVNADSTSQQQLSAAADPDAIDWRDKNAITPIKDQKKCGACWAFSATAVMEAAYWLAYNQTKSFSEQMCVDCANSGRNTCQRGGTMDHCYAQVIKGLKGAEIAEADYPYKGTSGNKCASSSTKLATPTGVFTDVVSTLSSEAKMKTALATHPTIAAAMDASPRDFMLYKSGVYSGNCRQQVNHGVAIVGYGTSGSTPYWIVRNSWGTTWGLKGYALLKRGSNQCRINTMNSYVVAQKK